MLQKDAPENPQGSRMRSVLANRLLRKLKHLVFPQDKWFGTRHAQILLMFSLMVIAYAFRVNLSVGIVAMTDKKVNPAFHVYNWDNNNVILSSFFWGYIVPQVGAGQLAKAYGPKWFLVVTMTVCSILSIFIPVMADTFGSWGVIICRIGQGLAQGFIFPSMHNLLSHWAPVPERGGLSTFVYAGGPFGTIVSMPISGYLASSSIGWPSIFYIFGGVGLVWVLLWTLFGANSPAVHKNISSEERMYIEKSLGHDVFHESEPTPWMAIFTSLPFWALFIAHCGQNWGFWTLLTEIPTYMAHVLHFDIKENGLLSALPYTVLWVLSIIIGLMSDYGINKGYVKTGTARKICQSIGHWLPAIALVGLGYVRKEQTNLAVGLLVMAVGFNAGTYCGFQVNHIDLSPKHAGTLMGLTNAGANVFSIVAPLAVQYIVTDEADVIQWRYVFLIAACIYFFCNLFFVICGSGEIQQWDDCSKKTDIELANPAKPREEPSKT